MPDSDGESQLYACPHCHAELQIAWPPEPFLRCPECGDEFSLPVEATPPEVPVEVDCNHELDGEHIQRIVLQRRADIRLRSYFLLGAFGCAGAAVTFVYRVVERLFLHQAAPATMIVYLGLAAAAIAFTSYFWIRARRLTLELNKPLLPDPVTPPDFSQLSDGSQQVKALEELQD